MAVGIDASMVLIALVLFVGVFFLSGGVLTFSRDMPLLGSVLVILALFYWFLCLLANHGSPGMQFAGVRGFEGETGSAAHGQLGLQQLTPAAPPPPLPMPRAPVALRTPVRPTIDELVIANKILANEKVLEAYGNVSVRDERNPNRFFLPRQVTGTLLTAADVIEYDITGNPASGDPLGGHPERFMHSEIYKARPEVMAIVHWRAAEIIPFTASSVRLRPVSESAAFLGEGVPVIDVSKMDGGVDFSIRTRASAQALAEALGDKSAALLRGHGALVAATSLRAAVGMAYYMNLNARQQVQAIQLGGEVNYVAVTESRTATPLDEFDPAWEFFKQRLPANGTHR
jgi:ribulose-5-phosphate 4-epimerase/fuculose-1-phosphate aldolase